LLIQWNLIHEAVHVQPIQADEDMKPSGERPGSPFWRFKQSLLSASVLGVIGRCRLSSRPRT